MHELSILSEMVQILREAHNSHFDQITKVQIEAGLLSNVQPVLIQNAFEALVLEQPALAAIDLEIVVLPIIAFCASCGQPFEVSSYRFVCPNGHPSRQLIQGDELRIGKVEFLTH